MNLTTLQNFIFGCFFFLASLSVYGARIKDLTDVRGSRSNQLYGYGIVTGLAGQGDSRIEYTELGILNALETLGIRADKADKSRNIAAVMVTADIGPFAKEGSRMDVTVSSIGNADSLQGGILLQTPLYGADGKVYTVAQGAVSIGGLSAGGGGGANVQVNHPTVGIVSNGGSVEREIESNILSSGNEIELILRSPDSLTAVKIADAINKFYLGTSIAIDAGVVNIQVPVDFRGQTTNFLAVIGGIDVKPDVPARVIINERTGTIVATESVRISPVAVSSSNVTIFLNPTTGVSQPLPFSQGATTILQGENADLIEEVGRFESLDELDPPGASTVNELASALNKLGLTTREMTSILQSIKNAGALQAELIIN
ncbi:MAG TPA: flagellar biosynthesis protein FlgA [Flavobacteriales bacterium]|jgi:flagellar P-ring protein precursor FlgI|nr:flagellar biosynthesis protein FlgA [Flavobacteriales bacterium]